MINEFIQDTIAAIKRRAGWLVAILIAGIIGFLGGVGIDVPIDDEIIVRPPQGTAVPFEPTATLDPEPTETPTPTVTAISPLDEKGKDD